MGGRRSELELSGLCSDGSRVAVALFASTAEVGAALGGLTATGGVDAVGGGTDDDPLSAGAWLEVVPDPGVLDTSVGLLLGVAVGLGVAGVDSGRGAVAVFGCDAGIRRIQPGWIFAGSVSRRPSACTVARFAVQISLHRAPDPRCVSARAHNES